MKVYVVVDEDTDTAEASVVGVFKKRSDAEDCCIKQAAGRGGDVHRVRGALQHIGLDNWCVSIQARDLK
jgi:hypothetical protein